MIQNYEIFNTYIEQMVLTRHKFQDQAWIKLNERIIQILYVCILSTLWKFYMYAVRTSFLQMGTCETLLVLLYVRLKSGVLLILKIYK